MEWFLCRTVTFDILIIPQLDATNVLDVVSLSDIPSVALHHILRLVAQLVDCRSYRRSIRFGASRLAHAFPSRCTFMATIHCGKTSDEYWICRAISLRILSDVCHTNYCFFVHGISNKCTNLFALSECVVRFVEVHSHCIRCVASKITFNNLNIHVFPEKHFKNRSFEAICNI